VATKLRMFRGTTETFDIEAKQANGVDPLNLSPGTLYFTVKNNIRQADSQAPIRKNSLNEEGGIQIVAPLNGQARITIDPADTAGMFAPGVYQWDLKFATYAGPVIMLATGSLDLMADVTRSTSSV
jgi:hypothetical protein